METKRARGQRHAGGSPARGRRHAGGSPARGRRHARAVPAAGQSGSITRRFPLVLAGLCPHRTRHPPPDVHSAADVLGGAIDWCVRFDAPGGALWRAASVHPAADVQHREADWCVRFAALVHSQIRGVRCRGRPQKKLTQT